ncbi:MAG: peptide-methionine (S)-S-oxide reductase MsrA [Saprospiraceae bacterium]|nr:peptide-methionine (S)-S-oxide reductase MsrA [Saprospiraceae bacterium]MDW8230078.1 peptide-methionine (S)-S-oxide reductase MsrA [Saprospiraceae bacterium]
MSNTRPDATATPAEKTPNSVDVATLGGGCFWCIEAVFLEMKGVLKVESGYAGGHVPNPTYREVCTGTTGHAEVVQITYDPSVTSYADLLEVFFTVHDPTTLNRQGNDVGTQYRSVIFYHNDEQKRIAQEAKKAAAQLWPKPIVTEIAPLDRFYKAEDYHQNYYRNNPSQPYCIYVVGPKVEKFRQKFRDRLKQ